MHFVYVRLGEKKFIITVPKETLDQRFENMNVCARPKCLTLQSTELKE